MTTNDCQIHFIDIKANQVIAYKTASICPRIGEEVRLTLNGSDETFFKVVQVVWCFDEPNVIGQRVNVGLKKIKV